jgi:hydroxypyruvate isomerase
MPRFAANLSMLFTEVPLLERFEAAAKAGFSAVEIQFPYEAPAAAIRKRMDAHHLRMVLHNLPAGDFAAGDRGIACNPARVAEFRAGVKQAVEYATTLGVPQLNCLAGKAPAGVAEDALRATFLDNARYAATALRAAGLKLLIEPINNFDVPGFWVNHTAKAVGLIDELGMDNVFVQYDVYHAQRYEGELANTISRYLPYIAHIQVADNPGRFEPGTGEIHYDFIFEHLHRIGYTGFVGCEYKPSSSTEEGLGWMASARLALAGHSTDA